MNDRLSINQPVIDIRNLDHYFGKGELRKQVLCNINLAIHRGEIVLMTGPSGSGKTTLLTLVSGLRTPQSGSLKVLGKELFGATKKELVQARRNNGYIFQAHNLHHSLTAIQNVKMSLEVHSRHTPQEIHDRAAEMLARVGLAD